LPTYALETNLLVYAAALTSEAGSEGLPSSMEEARTIASKRNISQFKIMTLARGFTEEADRLLDYLVRSPETSQPLQRVQVRFSVATGARYI
jgi:hypothetical protein